MNSDLVPAKYCSKCGVLKPLTKYHFLNKQAGTVRAACKDCTREQSKQYYHDHREEILVYKKQYQHENRDYINEYRRNCYQRDDAYRFTAILRARLTYVLNTLDTIDSQITLALVGCSSDWLRLWLEYCNAFYCYNSLFTHVDHVYPLSAFNILDPNGSRDAMYWKNLRIIDADDNRRKGKSHPTDIDVWNHSWLINDFCHFMRRVHPSVPH